MKNKIKLTLAGALVGASLVFGTPSASACGCGQLFEDVRATDHIAPYVSHLVKSRVVTGFEDGTFKPNQTITRKHVILMLSRSLGNQHLKYSDKTPYQDTQYLDKESKQAINFLYSKGVLPRTDKLMPNDKATRGVLSEWTVDSFGLYVPEIALNGFTFHDLEGSRYRESALSLKYYGIIRGYQEGEQINYKPQNSATRAHFAQIVSQAIDVRKSLEETGGMY